jgi:rSAM/selenodomain-associated transferase 2
LNEIESAGLGAIAPFAALTLMKVSVIIPALNESENIRTTLLSVKQQEGDFEVIVVDGGSSDDTKAIAKAHAQVIPSEPGRAIQMNAGARLASGEVLLFLHADSSLHPYALGALRQALTVSQTVGGTFTLRFDTNRFLLRLYAFFTRLKFRYFHYGDQGIFVRRATFEQLGGFKEMPLMEDIDFLLRLRKQGRVALIQLPVTTSARRFVKQGLVRQQLLNGFLLTLYRLGVKPEILAKWYLPNRVGDGRTPKGGKADDSPSRRAGDEAV